MIITSDRFGFEIEVTAKICKLKCRMFEVPISYYGRTYEQGKKIGARDGVAAIWYLIKYNLFGGLRDSYRTLPALVDRESKTAPEPATKSVAGGS